MSGAQRREFSLQGSESSVQSPESSVQRPESSVQSPASSSYARAQEFQYAEKIALGTRLLTPKGLRIKY